MANTRKATKRARQSEDRNARNQIVRSATRSSLRVAVESLRSKDPAQAKKAIQNAVKALSKAASKGCIPKGRAARKVSRLVLLAKKTMPEAVQNSKSK